MKVLDPQAALLTTAEVHEFLNSNTLRATDKKIGAYSSVNLHNCRAVRRDLESYIQGTTPYVVGQSPTELWMKDLLKRLKKYDLTKTEVFSLVNLGIGLNESSSAAANDDEVEEAQDESNGNQSGKEDVEIGDDADPDSGLDRMLFGLVVEESDERFAGDDGEERITEILSILKETTAGAKSTSEKEKEKPNGG